MDLDDFIFFAHEADTEMEAFTTADPLSVDGDVTFVSTAQDNSDDDETAESGATCEGSLVRIQRSAFKVTIQI
uniref:AlNc14C632G12298 protein n=1 Tax=Albugo laibachii Nc14 TaxID=890382 RepID=F0X1J5_9STRA|nr:AlNc14C632G12298 [Albugo laibachii Nc14]|eukprot:CCA27685.1 AlNc14C632G12298 [Albugo laibachii Nc14]